MKKRRILVMMHQDLIPPDDVTGMSEKEINEFRAELDVVTGLKELGHNTQMIGVIDELTPLGKAIANFEPDIVFNLLEEYSGKVLYDQNVVSYLELKDIPYSGCNPRGLVLGRDKALSKKIVHYHRVRTPRFQVCARGLKVKRAKHLEFPLIVKSLIEEGSAGIAQASIVRDDEALATRVKFIHDRIGTDAIVEQFIAGREIYVGVTGNQRVTVLPPWELFIEKAHPDSEHIATSKVKWDPTYQEKRGVKLGAAKDISPELGKRIKSIARRVYRGLALDGYARVDFRLTEDGQLYFLEANPNPDISKGGEIADAAESVGISYTSLLQRVVNLGLRRADRQ